MLSRPANGAGGIRTHEALRPTLAELRLRPDSATAPRVCIVEWDGLEGFDVLPFRGCFGIRSPLPSEYSSVLALPQFSALCLY